MKEISQIEIYEALKGKLGENEAKLLVEYIESKKKEVATKEDIQRLEEIVKMVEKSTKEDIQRLEEIVRGLEKSTKEDIQRLEQFVKEEIRKLENEINELRKEQRRNLYWILGFHITLWATTIAGIITILLRIKP